MSKGTLYKTDYVFTLGATRTTTKNNVENCK